MIKFEITLKSLRAAGECFLGYNKLVRALQGKPFSMEDECRESYIRFAHKEPISLLYILKTNGLDDALWALRCVPDADRDNRLFAVWCARQVQHLTTDPRSIAAIDVAERFANGEATLEELESAEAAAWAAARAARDAALDAARAARDAARDAAQAAQAAAWAAQAAQAAAWAAAQAAAWAAARDAQKEMLISMCMGEAPWQGD